MWKHLLLRQLHLKGGMTSTGFEIEHPYLISSRAYHSSADGRFRHCLHKCGFIWNHTSVSMRLHLSFTWRQSSSLSEPGRFEHTFKSGAFSKQYGFIGLVNGETRSL